MTPPPDIFWRTPAVRHLAWLCRAPSLICNDMTPVLAEWLPDDIQDRLLALDRDPSPLLAALSQSQSLRLGHYFEELYHFLLSELLGWPVLARNTQIRSDQGHTLGELDFIVRNPGTQQLEHHEIAVKFYLGVERDKALLWFGPNPSDRLDLKSGRMISHQLTMTQRPETRRLLATRGISGDIRPVLVMPGYLFRPLAPPLPELPPGSGINPRHEIGGWLYHSQLAQLDTRHWTLLRKPHWLGPYQQSGTVDSKDTRQALNQVDLTGRPALFARMAPSAEWKGLVEAERWFVVPDSWPGNH